MGLTTQDGHRSRCHPVPGTTEERTLGALLPAAGLNSNGVRALGPEEFLCAAASQRVPFAHPRGGLGSYGLANAPAGQVAALGRRAGKAVPITLVTANVDLSDPEPYVRKGRHRRGMLDALMCEHLVRQATNPAPLVRAAP